MAAGNGVVTRGYRGYWGYTAMVGRPCLRLIVAISVVGMATAVDCVAQATATDNEQLLRTLIVHNQAARKQFQSYVLDQEWTVVTPYIARADEPLGLPKEEVTARISMRVIRKGEFFSLSRTERLETASKKWSQERQYECVLNEQYFAEYSRKPHNSMTVWEHASPETMMPEARDLSLNWYPKPNALDFAIGSSELSLADHFAADEPNEHWSVEAVNLDGEPVYKIIVAEGNAEGGAAVPYWYYYIDAKRGFLLRGQDYILADGSIGLTTRVTLSQSGDSWFPEKVSFSDRFDTFSTLEINVRHFEPNPEIGDTAFSIASISFLPEARMSRILLAGRKVLRYKINDAGEWSEIARRTP